jgi:hypothetical protein
MGNTYTRYFVDAKKAIEEFNNAYSKLNLAKAFCVSLNTQTGKDKCWTAIAPKIETIYLNLLKIRRYRDYMKDIANFPEKYNVQKSGYTGTPLQKQQLNDIETEFNNCIDKSIEAYNFGNQVNKSGMERIFAKRVNNLSSDPFSDYSEYSSHTKNVLPLIFILALVLLFAYRFVPNRKWKKTALLILAVLEVVFLMYYSRGAL